MDQTTKRGSGIALMLIGTVGIFTPVLNFDLPLPVLSVAVLLLALGTLLVGISDIGEGEYSV